MRWNMIEQIQTENPPRGGLSPPMPVIGFLSSNRADADSSRTSRDVSDGPTPDITDQKLVRRLGHDPLVNHSYLDP
jgi:hypothetical protein